LTTVRICFVCLGNICRSPAAAAVFADLAASEGVEVTIDSAGTSRYHLGEAPHEHTRREAGRRRIAIDHRAREFMASDFDDFDVVVAMDRANRRDLLQLALDDAARSKVRMLRVDGVEVEVPDPWALSPSAYADMFDLLDTACRELVAEIRAGRLSADPGSTPSS
jgi:low molecular weight protein-tyrosine phosphatase